MNMIKNKTNKKIRKISGFSLSETLVALLIVLLITSAVAGGVDFASRQYKKSMLISESKVLCSSLRHIIKTELENTGTIKLGEQISGDQYKLNSFFSRTYAIKESLSSFYSVEIDDYNNKSISDDGYGEILLGTVKNGKVVGNLLLGSASYTSFDLKAKADVSYAKTDSVFHVNLSIRSSAGEELSSSSFDVIPLNQLTEETE